MKIIQLNHKLMIPALLAPCMLAMVLAACMVDELDTNEIGLKTAPEEASLASLTVRDMTLDAVHARLVNKQDIGEDEQETYDEILYMMANAVAPSTDSLHAARSVCYSALVGNSNHSLIMVPLPSNQVDLDAVCHLTINSFWHAGGVAKPRYFDQDCPVGLDNTLYGGGYTSYVAEAYFEGNRTRYYACNGTNSVVCCSPQFPN